MEDNFDEGLIFNAIKYVHDDLKSSGMPPEVAEIFMYCIYKVPVGGQKFAEFRETAKKYPQYFHWDTKYLSVPKEVHEAYNKEYDELFGFKFEDFNSVGVENQINKGVIYKEPTLQDFKDLLLELDVNNRQIEVQNKEYKMKRKALWDKHYKKFSLKYDGGILY